MLVKIRKQKKPDISGGTWLEWGGGPLTLTFSLYPWIQSDWSPATGFVEIVALLSTYVTEWWFCGHQAFLVFWVSPESVGFCPLMTRMSLKFWNWSDAAFESCHITDRQTNVQAETYHQVECKALQAQPTICQGLTTLLMLKSEPVYHWCSDSMLSCLVFLPY